MEIIRFFGPSGAGKETYIRKIFKNSSFYGKNIVDGKNNIIISESSLNFIGQYPGDISIKLRMKIIEDVMRCQDNDSILIKGQNVDLENNIPLILLSLKKEAIHKVVFLTTTYEILLQRCRKKSWWNPSYEVGGESAHKKRLYEGQIKILQRISGISFIFIDSGNYKYKVTKPLR